MIATQARQVDDEVLAGARPLRRRRSLPGGRAVLGAFLVTAASAGVFAAYTGANGRPDQRYVVARRALVPGSAITAGDLTGLPMRLPAGLAADRAFTDARQLVGAVVIAPLAPGELVQASAVLHKRGGPQTREVSITLESGRSVAGTLRPGDRVDVAGTFGAGEQAYTLFVVRAAEVLARSDIRGALGDRGGEVLTLSLGSADDALALAHAVSAGQLTVVRATGAEPAGADPYRAPSSRPQEEPR